MTWNSPREQAEGLVHLFLEERLADANEPPGVREAVIQSLIDQVETIKHRSSEQIGQLRSPSSQEHPRRLLQR